MGELAKKNMELIRKNDKGLVVIPNNIPISRQHREIYLSSLNFPKIRLIEDKNVVVKTIHAYINQAIMDKGVNMQVEEIDYLKAKVTEDIINDFNGYSLEELRLAFHYGVRKEFGEYYGLNPVTFYGWLKSFRYELLPPINQKVQKLLPKPEPIIPTQEETDLKVRETLYGVYFKLCTSGEYDFYDIGNVCYRHLDRYGLIPYSNKQKMDFVNESRNSFGTSVVKRNSDFAKKGKDFHKIDLDRAFEMIGEKSNPTFEHQIRVGAMRLALFHFLKDCAEQDIDLKEMIENTQTEKKD
jgi:hypothetical protein